jgi:hypothetical protein
MRFYLIPLTTLALSACSLAPHDAPQAAYQVESGFIASLKAANAYAALPHCTPPAVTVCSQAAIVAQIDAQAHKASIAVLGLQAISRDTKADATDIEKANLAAQHAVEALNKLIPPASAK